MKPLHIICECGEEFLFSEGWPEHLREKHGFILVHPITGGVKMVPILSHPVHSEEPAWR